MEDEYDDFFGNDDFDRGESPVGEEAIEVNDDDKKLKDVIEKGIRKPKKLQNPRLALNERMLTGPRGIKALQESFKNFNPNPKDDPYANLDKMLKIYAHWGHMMFPKMKTEDLLSRVETLGTRREVKVFMARSRMGESTDVQDLEEETKKKRRGNNDVLIDDGADDDENQDGPTDLFEDKIQKDVNNKLSDDNDDDDEPSSTRKTEEAPKRKKIIDEGDDDEVDGEAEWRAMQEEREREERNEEMEDELLADFANDF